MPNGGTIHLEMQNVILSSGRTLPLPPGKYVLISVRDEGPGIARENLARIFDPYFTTKAGGSGLGLASAYLTLQRHQGLILAESEPGRGTTFRLYLPAVPVPSRKESEPPPLLPGIHGRVLLMDDEPLILNLGAVVLKRLGYEVVLAREGTEAVEHFRQAQAAGQRFTAVILDLTGQGGLSGPETLKRLAGLDPSVQAVISSGFLDDPVMMNCREYGFVAAISKPYHASDLGKILSALSNKATAVDG
jgi:two-component system, cell cycle sensor histidine kinase and response regulator CckA